MIGGWLSGEKQNFQANVISPWC